MFEWKKYAYYRVQLDISHFYLIAWKDGGGSSPWSPPSYAMGLDLGTGVAHITGADSGF